MRPVAIPGVQPPSEFGIDLRTGKPTISTLESLLVLISRNLRGLIFGESWRWNHPVEGSTPEVTAFFVANLEQVPIPGHLGVRAYPW